MANKQGAKIALVLSLIGFCGFIAAWMITRGSAIASPQEETITQRQIEHSRVFSDYDIGPDLRELAARGTGDVVVVDDTPIQVLLPSQNPNPLSFFRAITCDADAIVIGVLRNQLSSHLTEGGAFIFTEYELEVEQVLKNNAVAPIEARSNIIVARSGGAIQLNGRTVRAIDDSFTPFETGGRYALFVRFIPATGAYRAFSSGSFQLRDGRIVKLGDAITQWGEVRGERLAFIAELRVALAGDCPSGLRALRR